MWVCIQVFYENSVTNTIISGMCSRMCVCVFKCDDQRRTSNPSVCCMPRTLALLACKLKLLPVGALPLSFSSGLSQPRVALLSAKGFFPPYPGSRQPRAALLSAKGFHPQCPRKLASMSFHSYQPTYPTLSFTACCCICCYYSRE